MVVFKGTVYPAHMAAYQGDLQVLQSLVSRGIAGVNDRDDTNCTPAHKGWWHELVRVDE